jgi:hypothetical protein
MNSSRVQSDLMDRVEESQGQLDAEIRKLLHAITRIATIALEHAREARSRGAAAVEENLLRIAAAEKEIHLLLVISSTLVGEQISSPPGATGLEPTASCGHSQIRIGRN